VKVGLSEWKRGQSHDKQVYADREKPWPKETTRETLEFFGKDFGDLRGARILEVGSGMGMVHSLDFDSEAVAVDPLTMHNKDKLSESHAELTTGIGEQLPFETGSFDIVMSYNVFDHCIDPVDVLNEISRVTRDDGELLLEVNTYEVPQVVRNSIIDILDEEHPHHFSSREVAALITKNGYEIAGEQLLNRLEFLKNPTLRRLGALPFRMRRYFVTAEKV
jgi:SAM-dependent methyltransferase